MQLDTNFIKFPLFSELESANADSAALGEAYIDSSFMCLFTVDLNNLCGSTYLASYTGKCGVALDEPWHCRIRDIQVCNGYSNCLTDECNCGEDVFKCADGVGCITSKNLCNGFKDCRDGSDECMCEGVVTCYVGELNKFCVPKEKYCQGRLLQYSECKACPLNVDCTGIVPDRFFSGENNKSPFQLCRYDYNRAVNNGDLESSFSDNGQFQRWCNENCAPGFRHFCGSVEMSLPTPTFFVCNLTLRGNKYRDCPIIGTEYICDNLTR